MVKSLCLQFLCLSLIVMLLGCEKKVNRVRILVKTGDLKGTKISINTTDQVQNQQPGDIWDSYLIWGIPRYLLVNADGTILNSHAPRPSSGSIIGELEEFLSKNGTVTQ